MIHLLYDSTLVESTRMDDGETCMAFTVSFVPNTGNKYFVGACDEHLRLYDFEEAKVMESFSGQGNLDHPYIYVTHHAYSCSKPLKVYIHPIVIVGNSSNGWTSQHTRKHKQRQQQLSRLKKRKRSMWKKWMRTTIHHLPMKNTPGSSAEVQKCAM